MKFESQVWKQLVYQLAEFNVLDPDTGFKMNKFLRVKGGCPRRFWS